MQTLFKVTRGPRAKDEKTDENKEQAQKKSAGSLRIQVDISELDLPENAIINFPNPDDLMNFQVTIRPTDGLWRGATFVFSFEVHETYPHRPPKVVCLTPVYHPNINTDGAVCLNILRDDWRPVLTIQAVVHGLIFLFLEPNAKDPLNHNAAALMRDQPDTFRQNVAKSLRGGIVDGISYPRNQ